MSKKTREFHLRPGMTADVFRRRGDGFLPGLVGMEVTALEPGLLASKLAVRRELLAPNGFLHAASVIALADTSCGYGCAAHLPEGAENFTTIELKANFLGTVREGAILCEARPEHVGRNTQVWDALVIDEASGRRIAMFRCTQMVLWPKTA